MTDDNEIGAYGIVDGYLTRFRWKKTLRPQDLDELFAVLLHSCVRSLISWQADAGRNRVSWCWQSLHRDAGRWWKKHRQWEDMVRLDSDLVYLQPPAHERGYQRAEDQADLQALADRRHFTAAQENAVHYYAVHGVEPGLAIAHDLFPEYTDSTRGRYATALRKFRAAAAEIAEAVEQRLSAAA